MKLVFYLFDNSRYCQEPYFVQFGDNEWISCYVLVVLCEYKLILPIVSNFYITAHRGDFIRLNL